MQTFHANIKPNIQIIHLYRTFAGPGGKGPGVQPWVRVFIPEP